MEWCANAGAASKKRTDKLVLVDIKNRPDRDHTPPGQGKIVNLVSGEDRREVHHRRRYRADFRRRRVELRRPHRVGR